MVVRHPAYLSLARCSLIFPADTLIITMELDGLNHKLTIPAGFSERLHAALSRPARGGRTEASR